MVEQAPTTVGSVSVYHVVDGQQRLTTLQLLLDAAHQLALRKGHDSAAALAPLVRNTPEVLREDAEQLKVWPTLSDRDAFVAAMGAPLGGPRPVAAVAGRGTSRWRRRSR